jgi:hypothetical protein
MIPTIVSYRDQLIAVMLPVVYTDFSRRHDGYSWPDDWLTQVAEETLNLVDETIRLRNEQQT